MARVRQQAAVIPYRIRKERVEVALVTTSGGKGWIVPKGSVDDWRTAARRGHPRSRRRSRPAGSGHPEAARPLSPRNGHGPCRVEVY